MNKNRRYFPNTKKSHYRMSITVYNDILASLRKENKNANINDVIRYLNETLNPYRRITMIAFFGA